MFSLRHLVIATSTALVLSGSLAGGASAAPLPTSAATVAGQQDVPTFSVDQALSDIAKARSAAGITVGTTTRELDSQINKIAGALENADIASMQASEDFAVVEDTAAKKKSSAPLSAIAGTNLAALSTTAAEDELQQASASVAIARTAADTARTELNSKRTELIAASAQLRNTTVAVESKRIEKAQDAANLAEFEAMLKDSETSVPDLETANAPALTGTPVAAGITGTGAGTAAMAVTGVTVTAATKKAAASAAAKRTKRINTSVTWAKKVAANNKYKYRYGSTGPTYFDCSGYTGKAFSNGGKKLQRTSSAQYKAAPTKVKLKNMKKGDLVFWSSNGGRSFYHVALYLGSGKIAHARNPSAGISVTNLYYAGKRNIHSYAGRY